MTRPLLNTPTAELWAEFRNLLAVTAENFKRMAVIWCELKERGEDMSAYANPLTARLPAVASGKLLPEILIRYAAKPELLDAAESLVPEDQAKLAYDSVKLPVAVWKDGAHATVKRRPAEMTAAEVRQVFGGGTIRTPREQALYMPPEPARDPRGRYTEGPDLATWLARLPLDAAQRDDLNRAVEILELDPLALFKRILIEQLIVRPDAPSLAMAAE